MPTQQAGLASREGTERFRQRCAAEAAHFRPLQEWWASSIGLGTYLGDADEATDRRYGEAVHAALACGCNVFDTAINYRCQRSERVLGRALAEAISRRDTSRDEILLCTKGGYLPFDGAVPRDPARYVTETVLEPGLASYEEIVAGCHCLAPAYLDHALRTSLSNLQVAAVDVYYLHNPEEQLAAVDRSTFLRRMQAAFELLEQRAADGWLGCYGIATWNGLRTNPTARGYLSLAELAAIAEAVGGRTHRFRAVQLPYNLAMPEAFTFANQTVGGRQLTPLDAAQQLGCSVVASASLLQGRLTRLPAKLEAAIPNVGTSAQRALQFVRSTPGVTTALAGMQRRQHVEENLQLARQPLLPLERLRSLFDRSSR